MSEERTQPPSKRRRQLARERGQVAHSPELTAAAGWLAAVVLFGILGDDLALRLASAVRGSLARPPVLWTDTAAVVAHVRGVAVGLAWPLAAIVAGFAAGALAAHQLQVRGLWATSLVAPDPARLWLFASGPGLAVRAQHSVWSAIKTAALLATLAWTIHGGWTELSQQSSLEGPNLARAAGRILLGEARVLAVMLLVLGVADYAIRYRRFEAMLRTTLEEQREDRRVIEGDPAARAQRRQVARAWRGDSPQLLTGASLLLCGSGGLTLVLAGGPPPRRVTIRTIVRGSAGLRLRRCPEARQIPVADAPELARRLARRPTVNSPIASLLFAELAAIWPAT
jgi:flagellar biosynthetic protein FlhB